MPDTLLSNAVLDRIKDLGDGAADYFGVPPGLIAQWLKGSRPVSIAAAEKVYAEAMAERAKALPMPQIAAAPSPIELIGSEQVVILMPIYETIEPLTFITLVRCMKLYGMEKISIIPVCRTLIDEARNTLVQKFMAIPSKPEWCVFLDADQIFPCGSGAILRKMGLALPEPKASRNALVRLMSHPKDKRIVGAVYGNRRGNHKPALELAYRSAQEDTRARQLFTGENKEDGLVETGWIGFGMVRIHRSVFEDMQKAAVEGGPLAEIAPPKGREGDAFGYFGRTSVHRGEDIVFCRRCQKIGIPTHADFGLVIGHQGKQYSM